MSILLLAPYPDLARVASRVVADTGVDCIVREGNLARAVRIAARVGQDCELDVLISRGGTATLLSRETDVPVVEIQVTGYDLLRRLHRHMEQNRRIAVIGYENVVDGARSIGEIAGRTLGYFPIRADRDVQPAVARARSWGADVVIGDTVSVAAAREIGMETEIVESGPESVGQALREATAVQRGLHDQLVRARRLRTLVDHLEEGVVFLGADDRILQVNAATAPLIGMPVSRLVNRDARAPGVFPEEIRRFLDGGPTTSGLAKCGGSTLLVQRADISGTGGTTDRAGSVMVIRDVGRIQELEARVRRELSTKGLVAARTFDDMVGTAPAFLRSVKRARQCSRTDSTILISGETGTGKEVFAQSIHNASFRKDGPFVAVNCAALPTGLLESELFGYTGGSFTGARKGGKPGLFELAHTGTMFLDEIAGMSYDLQTRLLRVLQEKQIMRIGGDGVVDVDVRIIAASNRDLHAETIAGRFRSDLYYRIKVLDVRLPPLRDRPEDIRPLVANFVESFAEQYGIAAPPVSDHLIRRLLEHRWPGNVRELQNLSEKMVVLSAIAESEGELIDEVTSDLSPADATWSTDPREPETLADVEYRHILAVLAEEGHNVTQAARVLGIDRTTLRRRLQRRGTETGTRKHALRPEER